jgi:monofunctional biosynthetic peptidoglycan transglycosylase
MSLAVVAAEDQKFPQHWGFDFESIVDAVEEQGVRGRLRGASTITQQVARNLFLWQGRSYLRKALEAYFTVLLELCWPKRRILEVYLNIAEFGEGRYGVGAAARAFFGKPPNELQTSEASLLAAVLPNPVRFRVRDPSAYVRHRAAWIESQMAKLGGPAYLGTRPPLRFSKWRTPTCRVLLVKMREQRSNSGISVHIIYILSEYETVLDLRRTGAGGRSLKALTSRDQRPRIEGGDIAGSGGIRLSATRCQFARYTVAWLRPGRASTSDPRRYLPWECRGENFSGRGLSTTACMIGSRSRTPPGCDRSLTSTLASGHTVFAIPRRPSKAQALDKFQPTWMAQSATSAVRCVPRFAFSWVPTGSVLTVFKQG